MKVIVGLGNHGRRFARYRHNVGYWCIDLLVKQRNLTLRRGGNVMLAQDEIAGHDVVFVKPRTFMNKSGEVVKHIVDRLGISLGELIIIYDDMDIPAGKIRLRPEGSAGGHNGLRSIIACLGTQTFPRIRIGIGHPSCASHKTTYVLSPFSKDEIQVVEDAVGSAAHATIAVLSQGIDSAMSQFN